MLPILLTGILLRICKGGMVSVKTYYNETVETVRRDLNGEQDFLTNEEVKRRQENSDSMNLRKVRKKVVCRFFWNSIKIFWC